ncbi:MAG: hypothetical protein IJY96_05680 [Oscillospiraceae bacterium]|nr:hypothetical protein [Oscillospiraceae bacterium]
MEPHGIKLSLTLYGSALTGEISGGWLRNAACCDGKFCALPYRSKVAKHIPVGSA